MDVDVGERLADESASPWRKLGDGEGFGPTGSFQPDTEKTRGVFPRAPVPQTDTGGWVEYTQARE